MGSFCFVAAFFWFWKQYFVTQYLLSYELDQESSCDSLKRLTCLCVPVSCGVPCVCVYRCPVVSWRSLHLHVYSKLAGKQTTNWYRFLRNSKFRVSSYGNTTKYLTNNTSRPQGRDLVWRGVRAMWACRDGSLALYHAWPQKAAKVEGQRRNKKHFHIRNFLGLSPTVPFLQSTQKWAWV